MVVAGARVDALAAAANLVPVVAGDLAGRIPSDALAGHTHRGITAVVPAAPAVLVRPSEILAIAAALGEAGVRAGHTRTVGARGGAGAFATFGTALAAIVAVPVGVDTVVATLGQINGEARADAHSLVADRRVSTALRPACTAVRRIVEQILAGSSTTIVGAGPTHTLAVIADEVLPAHVPALAAVPLVPRRAGAARLAPVPRRRAAGRGPLTLQVARRDHALTAGTHAALTRRAVRATIEWIDAGICAPRRVVSPGVANAGERRIARHVEQRLSPVAAPEAGGYRCSCRTLTRSC